MADRDVRPDVAHAQDTAAAFAGLFATGVSLRDIFDLSIGIVPAAVVLLLADLHVATCNLRDDVLHDRAVDVGEAEVAAAVAVGEAFVVDAQHVQHRGVQVVDAGAVFDGFDA